MELTPPVWSWASFIAEGDELLIAVEAGPDGDLIFAYASDAACEALGYAPGELIGLSANVLCGEKTNEYDRERFVRVLRTGQPAQGGCLIYTKDREVVYSEWQARRVDTPRRTPAVVASGTLVERRRPGEGDFRSLITAIEHASDAILVYEMPEGGSPRVQFANRAAELLTGYGRLELETASRLGPRTDRDSVNAMHAAMQRGESVRSRQMFYREDGSSYWVEINARPLLESMPGMWRWISIERDITEAVEREGLLIAERDAYSTLAAAAGVFLDSHERPRLDEAYAHAREHLLAAGRREALEVLERMYESALRRSTLLQESIEQRNATVEAQAAQSDAMSMLAHDIRGPLNSVIGYAELIAEVEGLPDDAQEYTRLVVRAGNRVVDITNEVIVGAQLARNEYKPAVERFDLLSLIESVVSLQPGGERARFDFIDDHIDLEADLSGVRHIISNLASNALKYSVDAHIEIAVRREGSEVAVIVRDAGIGIPADEISTVFDRFARASNARNSKIRGTGLGLYFVKQLVDRIGGTIAIASEVGIGTAVTVKLPLATLSPVDVPVVLSIESAGDERSLVASELRGVGYQVRVAQSIAGAEVVMRHERVCLVIADLDLFDPGNLDELRDASAQRSLPMLTIGSHCEDAAPDQLRKPFVAEDLLRKVDAIVPVASLAS